MDRIRLNKRQKEIFQLIAHDSYTEDRYNQDEAVLYSLEENSLVKVSTCKDGICHVMLTKFGSAYYAENPRLKGPSLLDKSQILSGIIGAAIGAVISSIVTCLITQSILR